MYSGGIYLAGNSIRAIKAVDRLRSVYQTIAYYLGIIFASILLVLFIVPIIRIVFFFLIRSYSFIVPKGPIAIQDIEDYQRLKKLKIQLDKSRLMQDDQSPSVPLIIRRLGVDAADRQMARLKAMMIDLKDKIEIALSDLDAPNFDIPNAKFRPVSESTLWNNRTKAYQYKV